MKSNEDTGLKAKREGNGKIELGGDFEEKFRKNPLIGGKMIKRRPKSPPNPKGVNNFRNPSNSDLIKLTTNVAKPNIERYQTQFAKDYNEGLPTAPSPEVLGFLFDTSVGQRKRYESAEELAELVKEYFDSKAIGIYDEETGELIEYRWRERITLGGLAVHLGVERMTLQRMKNTDEYGKILTKAKAVIESFNESMLLENRNPAGVCFILKNGFGWKDTQDVVFTPSTDSDQSKTIEELRLQLLDGATEVNDYND